MPLLQRPFADELAPEMEALSAQYRPAVEELWTQWLGDRLAVAGGVAVRRTRTNLAGDRVTLRLAGRVVLHLELDEPERARVAVLHSVSASACAGWLVRGATHAGDALVFRAGRLRVERQ